MTRPTWLPPEERELVEIRRPSPGDRAFGWELYLVARGAFAEAIKLFWALDGRTRNAGCSGARVPDKLDLAQSDAMLRALEKMPTKRGRATLLTFHLKLSAYLHRVEGCGLRVQGPGGFFGRQHAWDEEVGKWRSVAKHVQGGLAAELGLCVRHCFRLWRLLREAGVWASWRPKRADRGALVTQDGTQVYAQRRLVGGTSENVAARLPEHDRDRPARPPRPDSRARPLRPDERAEAFSWLDGLKVPF
jgi:hypothetical protein